MAEAVSTLIGVALWLCFVDVHRMSERRLRSVSDERKLGVSILVIIWLTIMAARWWGMW